VKVITLARKPLQESTITSNVLTHGAGGLNIGACRLSTSDSLNGGAYAVNPTHRAGQDMWTRDRKGDTNCFKRGGAGHYEQPTGRWPANLIFQHFAECRCEGVKKVKSHPHLGQKNPELTKQYKGGVFGGGGITPAGGYADVDGNETIANWVCAAGCPIPALDNQSGVSISSGGRIGNAQGIYTNQGRTGWGTGHEAGDPGFGDEGGASRYFKAVKP